MLHLKQITASHRHPIGQLAKYSQLMEFSVHSCYLVSKLFTGDISNLHLKLTAHFVMVADEQSADIVPRLKQIPLPLAEATPCSNKFHKILPLCNERWIKIIHPSRLSWLDFRYRRWSLVLSFCTGLERLINFHIRFRLLEDRS